MIQIECIEWPNGFRKVMTLQTMDNGKKTLNNYSASVGTLYEWVCVQCGVASGAAPATVATRYTYTKKEATPTSDLRRVHVEKEAETLGAHFRV